VVGAWVIGAGAAVVGAWVIGAGAAVVGAWVIGAGATVVGALVVGDTDDDCSATSRLVSVVVVVALKVVSTDVEIESVTGLIPESSRVSAEVVVVTGTESFVLSDELHPTATPTTKK